MNAIAPSAQAQWLRRYTRFCYTRLGRRLDRGRRPQLAASLKQADIHMSPGQFLATAATTSVVATAVALPLIAFHLLAIVQTPAWAWLAPLLAVLTGATTALSFFLVMRSRISKRRANLERELPFSLSELSVLASIGLSPIQLMVRMAQRSQDPAMTGEFRKVVHRTHMQGRDLITALSETAQESPSPMLRETLWDLGHIIHQGGNVGVYLANRSDEVLAAKRVGQKEFIATLGTFSEMYVTVVLMSVIFLGMGAFVVDAFGSTVGGLSAAALLTVLSYGFMPLVIVVVGILLSSLYTQVNG